MANQPQRLEGKLSARERRKRLPLHAFIGTGLSTSQTREKYRKGDTVVAAASSGIGGGNGGDSRFRLGPLNWRKGRKNVKLGGVCFHVDPR